VPMALRRAFRSAWKNLKRRRRFHHFHRSFSAACSLSRQAFSKKSTPGAIVPPAARDTDASAAHARHIVMEVERSLGFEPTDRELDKLGYDIESRVPGTGKLRFIEVKRRVSGAATITVTRNEILYSLNKPDDFILAIVEFHPDESHRIHYLRQPFQREPDFGVTSVNYDFADLLDKASQPS
jgi:hypothetical protein